MVNEFLCTCFVPSLHSRGVDRYSKGNVFLAGDAAHIHSPVGGQGKDRPAVDADGWINLSISHFVFGIRDISLCL